MGDVEYVYAELVSRTDDPENLNARLFEHEDVFRNWAAILRDNPHVPQSDGYLITFRFTSGAIGVHNANTLETDTNLLERVTLTGEGAVVAVEDWYRVRAAIKDQPPIFWEPLVDRQVGQGSSAANGLLRRGARVRRRDARRAARRRARTSTTAWRAWSWSPRCAQSIAEGRRVATGRRPGRGAGELAVPASRVGILDSRPRTIEIRELDVPELGPDGELVLRTVMCGICGSDLHRFNGSTPRATNLGHEILARVEQVPPDWRPADGRRCAVGDLVVPETRIPCHTCEYCRGVGSRPEKLLDYSHCP